MRRGLWLLVGLLAGCGGELRGPTHVSLLAPRLPKALTTTDGTELQLTRATLTYAAVELGRCPQQASRWRWLERLSPISAAHAHGGEHHGAPQVEPGDATVVDLLASEQSELSQLSPAATDYCSVRLSCPHHDGRAVLDLLGQRRGPSDLEPEPFHLSLATSADLWLEAPLTQPTGETHRLSLTPQAPHGTVALELTTGFFDGIDWSQIEAPHAGEALLAKLRASMRGQVLEP